MVYSSPVLLTGPPARARHRDAVLRSGGGAGRSSSREADVVRTRAGRGPVGGGDRGLWRFRRGFNTGAD